MSPSSSSLPPPVIYDPSKHHHLLQQIASLHRACVKEDGMLATILDYNNTAKLNAFWLVREAEVLAGSRVMVLQLLPAEPAETTSAPIEDLIVVGIATLDMPESETGPFRSWIEKLMVSPLHRRIGIARALMSKIEAVALEKKRELIMLDTEIGSPAEGVYPRLGYKVVGRIPRYGISPVDGRLVDEIFYYKDLRDE